VAKAAANGIHIEYETFGDSAARPLLMIGGLADQLIHWDDELCTDLSERGHFVIRFDSRDAGLSTKFDQAGVPDLGALARGEKGPPYTWRIWPTMQWVFWTPLIFAKHISVALRWEG